MRTGTPGRRQFLGGLLAAGLIPKPTWADAGSPAFLSAAARTDGTYVLCGITADLRIAFRRPLPARGHAAAAHPHRPEAVAFARRPGTFAVVIDCATGAQKAMLSAPEGRHFYGHGAFSADGRLLYTTENDFEAGRGRIGVWDTYAGYRRIAEWDSGGIGPHDIKRLPRSDVLVIANGGIDTHPDTGRTKLNIPTMRPNLTYVQAGETLETARLPQPMHRNSIRHLAVSDTGRVAFGMQWQGDGDAPPLIGYHDRGAALTLLEATEPQTRAMQGYIGSIACTADGARLAVTSPRGGLVQSFDVASRRLTDSYPIADVCGVALTDRGFAVTSGTGALRQLAAADGLARSAPGLMWDNHLIAVQAPT